MALSEGDVTLKKFTDAKVREPQLLALMKKINAVTVRPLKLGARVAVIMKDGTTFEGSRKIPKGDPADPLKFNDLERKFRQNAGLFVSGEKIDQLVEKIGSLEKQKEIGEIMALTNLGAR